ncbi:AGE family epimerase/isomerase [Caldibacillus lycopersici]|uniref:AGE family epimerase/isomerase n=1 Tax=Perspicuibacillus lycopersici TaxID=1325689 RepID=A0AAE3IRI6_9BACI|nr:AGE family epimerase/isomerase [Perspicuibacillus lycopersici]MCU9613126.1 AGE family epimerase/isomerase [Perspicuibacillus lycopersici]
MTNKSEVETRSLMQRMEAVKQEITRHLEDGVIPFWLKGIDTEYGGYLTCFDENGVPTEDTDKYIVTQTRMIWGMSRFYREYPENKELLLAARQGVEFYIKHFWDTEYGGWFWKTNRKGELLDDGKVTYGQSFSIYALAEYTHATGDPIGQEYAEKTFDLMQKYCTDTVRGGYYENLERDWQVSSPGFHAGDRKSLDIHMHIMEAFTTLALVSKKEIHRRKLKESIEIILRYMVNAEIGCGLNQFDLDFKPIPAINIRRTWNAERETGEVIDEPMDTTSYGHNVELAWLLSYAGEVLNNKEEYLEITKKLVDHALRYGVDLEIGGVYRDGPHVGEPLVKDKEWWQNCESLVGFLNAFQQSGDEKYLNTFENLWDFCKENFINHEVGEWYQLLDKNGNILVSDLGNPWKAVYHTGRALLESKLRLERLVKSLI